MSNPFVVISRPRSGTTFFRLTLSNHPDAVCFGEIFKKNRTPRQRPLPRLKIDAAILGKDVDPVDFLEKFSRAQGPEARGFKIMLNQNQRVLDEVFRRGWRVIAIHRSNQLACYASNLQTKATGQPHAPIGVEVKTAKVEFEPHRFDRFLRRGIKHWQQCFESRLPYPKLLQLEYLEFAYGDGFRRAFEFLGVKPVTVVPDLQKKNSSDIISRFTNPDEVVAHLEKIGHTEWQREVLDGEDNIILES